MATRVEGRIALKMHGVSDALMAASLISEALEAVEVEAVAIDLVQVEEVAVDVDVD